MQFELHGNREASTVNGIPFCPLTRNGFVQYQIRFMSIDIGPFDIINPECACGTVVECCRDSEPLGEVVGDFKASMSAHARGYRH